MTGQLTVYADLFADEIPAASSPTALSGANPQSDVYSAGEELRALASLARPVSLSATKIRSLAVPVFVLQNISSAHSLDQFVARKFAEIPSILGVYRERIENTLRFYLLAKDEGDKELERAFEVEKNIYMHFPEDELDFEILLGEELQCAVPSLAVRIWQRED
jgi:hypothetical protein